ncbi:hypothetical protein LOD99_104 [Oopsacas minuta]|uniref:Uncharacterized protein n=1 Tax=Oopsacas minuta TaxID=111878 RepID=A0AAV7KAP4_9METZ|nr:hypothetical protein LOD99_104 [Oopsacas minuta]
MSISDNITGSLACLGITSIVVVIHLVIDIILFILTFTSKVKSLYTYGTLVALPCLIIINILFLICFGLCCVGQCSTKIKCRKRRSELPFERSELPSYAEIPARGPAKNKRLQKPTPVIKSTNTHEPTPVIKSTNRQKPIPVIKSTNTQKPAPVIKSTNTQKPAPVIKSTNTQKPTPVIKSTNTQKRAIQPALLEKDILFSNQNIKRDNLVEIRVIPPVYYEIPALIPQTLPDSPDPDPDPVASKQPNSSVYDIPDSPAVPVAADSVHSDSPDPDPVVSKHPNSPVYDTPDSPVIVQPLSKGS